MGKKKVIGNCVGVVTVTTRIQNGGVTDIYQFKAGFAVKGWTDKYSKELADKMKKSMKEQIFADKARWGITDTSKVTFHSGVKVLECDCLFEN